MEYICNRCSFGSDELDEAIDAEQYFELMYEEHYCEPCVSEYRSGKWQLEGALQDKLRDHLDDEKSYHPPASEIYLWMQRGAKVTNERERYLYEYMRQAKLTPTVPSWGKS